MFGADCMERALQQGCAAATPSPKVSNLSHKQSTMEACHNSIFKPFWLVWDFEKSKPIYVPPTKSAAHSGLDANFQIIDDVFWSDTEMGDFWGDTF